MNKECNFKHNIRSNRWLCFVASQMLCILASGCAPAIVSDMGSASDFASKNKLINVDLEVLEPRKTAGPGPMVTFAVSVEVGDAGIWTLNPFLEPTGPSTAALIVSNDKGKRQDILRAQQTSFHKTEQRHIVYLPAHSKIKFQITRQIYQPADTASLSAELFLLPCFASKTPNPPEEWLNPQFYGGYSVSSLDLAPACIASSGALRLH